MKRVAMGLCTVLAIAGVLAVPQLFSQDTKTAPKTEVKKKEVKGRLPNNYAKLELTDLQKATIYEIQSKYAAELVALQAQLEALKTKQSNEVKGVLTPVQTAKLSEIEADVLKKKAEAKKAEVAKPEVTKVDPPKADTTKKPETKTTEKK